MVSSNILHVMPSPPTKVLGEIYGRNHRSPKMSLTPKSKIIIHIFGYSRDSGTRGLEMPARHMEGHSKGLS